jgi:hypothetical protein
VQQNEQQVGGSYGGQTAGFSEQAAPGYGYGEPVQQNEQQVGGSYGGQTAAFSEQAAPGYGHGAPLQPLVFHGVTPQPESSTSGDVPAGMHGDEPVGFAPSGGGEAGDGTALQEEPTHVSSEEPSFEDAGHAAAAEDAAGHDGGADAGQAVHPA